MGIIKRQASKSTITSFFGIVFSALSAIYIIPMVPQEIYGMVSILLGIASLVLPLTLLGLNSSILRFSETYTSIEREIFFNRVYIIHTLFSLVISCVFYLLSDWLLDLFYSDSRLIQDKGVYISCLIFLMGQFTMLSAYATSKYRLNITRILELIFQKAGIPLLLLAFVLNIVSLYFIVPCIVLFYLIRALGLWYFRFNSKPKLPTTISVHTDSLSIMKYSLFALVAVIIHQAIIDIDTLMVGALVSVSEAGIYKYAFYIAMIVDLPRINLIALLFPLISKYQSQNNFKGINEVYKRSSNLLFVLGSFLIILVIPNLDDFFLLIPNGDIYVHAKWIIIFIALSKLFNMVMGVNFEIIASSKKYYVIILINILVLGVVIISNNILIPLYGGTGAALATLIVWIIYNVTAFFYLKIRHQLSPFSRNTLYILFVLCVFITILVLMPGISSISIIDIGFRGLVSLLFLYISYKLDFSSDFSNLVIKFCNASGAFRRIR